MFLIIFITFNSYATEDSASSYNGPTGLINIPSGNILDNNEQTVSLHRYQIKYTYGLLSVLEIGLKTSLEGVSTLETLSKNFTFNIKGQLLDENKYFINLSVGIESTNSYLSINKHFKELNDINMYIGTGTSRFNYFFIGISHSIDPFLRLMFEYDGVDFNIGGRLLLSPQINFDICILGLKKLYQLPYLNDIINNNVVFGISYSEYLNIDLRGIF